MAEHKVWLAWDGLCLPTEELRSIETERAKVAWRNAAPLGACTDAEPPETETSRTSYTAHRATLVVQRAMVTIVSTTTRFAPCDEWCAVQISIKNPEKAGCIVMQVRDKSGELVYTERLSQSQIWSLPTTAPSGKPPLAPTESEEVAVTQERAAAAWAHPGAAPYTVDVLISNRRKAGAFQHHGPINLDQDPKGKGDFSANTVLEGSSNQVQVEVDSLALEAVSWKELYEQTTGQKASVRPGSSGKLQTQWVQYKLNELGWFAGPLDGDANHPDLKKAVIRYRQSHRELCQQQFKLGDESVFVLNPVTLNSGIDGGLLAKLEAGDNPRKVLEDAKVFSGEVTTGKLFVDAERLCQDAVEEFKNEGNTDPETIKSREEAAWMSLPRVPLRARLKVKGNDGEAHALPPGAKLEVHWSFSDAALDLTALPEPTTARPSQVKAYVDKTLKSAAAKVKSSFHNARTCVGGRISGDAQKDRASAFEQLGEHELTPSGPSDEWGARVSGDLVYFTPSTIAGDNYTVEAKVGELSAKTGAVHVWRRLHVAAHISWSPNPPADVWALVKQEYALAHLELVEPAVKKSMAEVSDSALEAAFKKRLGESTNPKVESTEQVLKTGHFDPRGFADVVVTNTTATDIHARAKADLGTALTNWEGGTNDEEIKTAVDALNKRLDGWRSGDDTDLKCKKDVLLKSAMAHYSEELKRITKKTLDVDPLLTGFQKVMAERSAKSEGRFKVTFKPLTGEDRKLKPFVVSTRLQAELVAARKKKLDTSIYGLIGFTQQTVLLELDRLVGPGVIVLEHQPNAAVDPGDGSSHITGSPPNMMLGGGKVIINQTNLGAYKPVHLFSHELAHALFLKHWRNAGGYVAWDHDQGDHNCVMSYIKDPAPTGDHVPGTAPHYARGTYEPRFCGKCNLKLRGWNIRAKVTVHGQKQDVCPRAWEDVVDPVPRAQLVPTPVEIPAPAFITEVAEQIMRDTLDDTSVDPKTCWQVAKGLLAEEAVGIYGAPQLSPGKTGTAIHWSWLPGLGVPGDVDVPTLVKTPQPSNAVAEWQVVMDEWAGQSARSATDNVHLNSSCPFYVFSDLLHESCHFFQKWTTAVYFYEGPTELFAALLSLRAQRLLRERGYSSLVDRFRYEFNPSYAEFTLLAIDQWLPALGMKGLAQLYIRDQNKPWTDLYDGSGRSTQEQKLKVALNRNDLHDRSVYKVKPTEPVAPIGRSTAIRFRSDIETAIQEAPAGIQRDLRAAIKEFLGFLEAESKRLPPKKRAKIKEKSGLERTYMQAKYLRRHKKQIAWARALREARWLKSRCQVEKHPFADAASDKLSDLLAFIDQKQKDLAEISTETGETEDELLELLIAEERSARPTERDFPHEVLDWLREEAPEVFEEATEEEGLKFVNEVLKRAKKHGITDEYCVLQYALCSSWVGEDLDEKEWAASILGTSDPQQVKIIHLEEKIHELEGE